MGRERRAHTGRAHTAPGRRHTATPPGPAHVQVLLGRARCGSPVRPSVRPFDPPPRANFPPAAPTAKFARRCPASGGCAGPGGAPRGQSAHLRRRCRRPAAGGWASSCRRRPGGPCRAAAPPARPAGWAARPRASCGCGSATRPKKPHPPPARPSRPAPDPPPESLGPPPRPPERLCGRCCSRRSPLPSMEVFSSPGCR